MTQWNHPRKTPISFRLAVFGCEAVESSSTSFKIQPIYEIALDWFDFHAALSDVKADKEASFEMVNSKIVDVCAEFD